MPTLARKGGPTNHKRTTSSTSPASSKLASPSPSPTTMKRTSSTVRNQNLAHSVQKAFERTSSNMAQAMEEAKRKQQEEQQQKLQQEEQDRIEREKKEERKRQKKLKKLKEEGDFSSFASSPEEAEYIAKYVGNAFDAFPEDQTADDVVDDLLPHPRAAPARLHLRGHGDAVKSCCFDAHHRLLFTAAWDGLVLVWNLEKYSSHPIARLQHKEWVNAVAITYVPDLTVITITEDGQMFGWQCPDLMVEKQLDDGDGDQNNNTNNDQEDGNQKKSNDNHHHTSTKDERHRKFEIVAQIQVSYGALTSLIIHSDFNFAFACCGDTTFGVHLSAGSVLREYVTSTEAMSLATVDAVLCIAQRNGTITLYDVVGSFILRELTGHRGAVRCISVIDSYTIMTAGDDCSIRVWNIASGACQSNRRRVHSRGIVALTHFYAERDRLVVSAGLDGVVKVMRQSNGATISSFGLLCNCFCIIPPVPVDPSNVEDVVEMLTTLRAKDATQGGDTAKMKEMRVLDGANLWEQDQHQQEGLQYTATAVFEMRNVTEGGRGAAGTQLGEASKLKGFGGGGVDHLHEGEQNNNVTDDDRNNNNMMMGGSPLVIPGTNRVLHASQISRHGRWSFVQTLMCGGPTGRLTRLSLEAAVARDNSTASLGSYM